MRRLFSVAACLIAAFPATAWAHTKWFNPNYCVSDLPAALPDVMSRGWIGDLLLFLGASLLAYWIDRQIPESVDRRIDAWIAAIAVEPRDIMRVGLGVFYLSLWVKGGLLMTPEMIDADEGVAWFQLFLALMTLSWRTTVIASLGTCVLYGMALAQYGFFHLLDYPFFLGVAFYLAIHSLKATKLTSLAVSVLVTTLAFSMFWGSVEKWAFWRWTMPILALHDEVTFGFDHALFIRLAGFVEFSLAFFLLVGRVFMRLAAMALLSIFMLAITSFGRVDAIGHLLIMLTLIVAVIEGEQPLHRLLRGQNLSPVPGAIRLAVNYAGMLLALVMGYYGIHAGLYGGGLLALNETQQAPAVAQSTLPQASDPPRKSTASIVSSEKDEGQDVAAAHSN